MLKVLTVPADGFSEYYYLKDIFLSFGLPPFNDSAYPPCGVITLNGGCNPDGDELPTPSYPFDLRLIWAHRLPQRHAKLVPYHCGQRAPCLLYCLFHHYIYGH
jgi:hypothetical protein